MRAIIDSCKILSVFIVITGLCYPVIVTGVAQVLFNKKANGSIIRENGVIKGSELIGQTFEGYGFFEGRPSASNYSSYPSCASNKSWTNSELKIIITERLNKLKIKNGIGQDSIIADELLFASGSGLDPHISEKAAFSQFERVCKFRKLTKANEARLARIIKNLVEDRELFIFGEKRVNVLKLNIEVEKLAKER